MKTLLAAALALATFAAVPASRAQVAYIPPNAPHPRFGGEFTLSEPGPVPAFWASECRAWYVRSTARRSGPTADPQTDAAIKNFVRGLIAKKPNYDDMTPAMAAAVRQHIDVYWPSLNRMGYASIAKHVDADEQGRDLYVVDQAGGATHWNIATRNGRIDEAFICAGTGL